MYLRIGKRVLIDDENREEEEIHDAEYVDLDSDGAEGINIDLNKSKRSMNNDNDKKIKVRKMDVIKTYWLAISLNVVFAFFDDYYVDQRFSIVIPTALMVVGVIFSIVIFNKNKISLELSNLIRYITTACGWISFFAKSTTYSPIPLLFLLIPSVMMFLNEKES